MKIQKYLTQLLQDDFNILIIKQESSNILLNNLTNLHQFTIYYYFNKYKINGKLPLQQFKIVIKKLIDHMNFIINSIELHNKNGKINLARVNMNLAKKIFGQYD